MLDPFSGIILTIHTELIVSLQKHIDLDVVNLSLFHDFRLGISF
jgi:hypothetical protein